MTREEFEELVAKGIDLIPTHIRKRMDNVVILIDDKPSREQREQNSLSADETLLGLYEGIPLTERGEGYGHMVLPDKITIFQNPIIASADSADEIPDIVADTIWHEVAHHFGMTEDEVRAKEKNRKKS
jgi:predicted Zn-dependent protease with MMP-like domain